MRRMFLLIPDGFNWTQPQCHKEEDLGKSEVDDQFADVVTKDEVVVAAEESLIEKISEVDESEAEGCWKAPILVVILL